MNNKVRSEIFQGKTMKKVKNRFKNALCNNAGMELVQVAILVAIAIVIGLIFRNEIQSFVDDIFSKLSSGSFS